MWIESADGEIYYGHFGKIVNASLPRYNLDIAACIRAAEAWCAEYPTRNFQLRYMGDNDKPETWVAHVLEIKGKLRDFHGPQAYATPAEALAWALHEAIK